MRVLVVEDDQALGLFLKKGLKLEGYEVDWVSDGEAALQHADEFQPDIMVLDLGLPRRDGLEVLNKLRAEHRDMSVLVLTGRSGLEDRLASLNSGADDCLLKPFSFHELTARCRALRRRRMSENNNNVLLNHYDLELNRVQRKAMRGGRSLDLTVKEFALLEYLLLHRGRVVSRPELLREVWSMSPDAGTNVVDVYINYLRRKLAEAVTDASNQASLIETVRGEGYRLREKKRVARQEEIPSRSEMHCA
ncbi:MAG: response regulator transcription factor [Acidobacteria bacterium]|nr:response regulator transcription factor [Acidobacteriota bacterium]